MDNRKDYGETTGGSTSCLPLQYGFYYAALCSIFALSLTYFPLYFKKIGFSPLQISILSATNTICTIFGSPFFQNLAFFSLPARTMIRVAPLLCALLFVPLATIIEFPSFLTLWAGYFFVLRAPASLVEGQAIRDSADGLIRFELVRAAGSFAFIIATLILGALIDARGISSRTTIEIGGAITILFIVSCWILSSRMNHKRGADLYHREIQEGSKVKAPREFSALVLTLALIWASHSVSSLYLSLYLQALGADGKMMSMAWGTMVGAEILMFLFFSRLQERLTLITILRVCIILGTMRWLIMGLFPYYSVVVGAGVLHAFSFAGTYSASLKLTHHLLPDILRDRGQAVLAAGGSGVGALVGALLAGFGAQYLTSYAEIHKLFFGSSLAMCLALLASFFVSQREIEGK